MYAWWLWYWYLWGCSDGVGDGISDGDGIGCDGGIVVVVMMVNFFLGWQLLLGSHCQNLPNPPFSVYSIPLSP